MMFAYPFSQLIREIFTSAPGASAKLVTTLASASNAVMNENFRTFGAPTLAATVVTPQKQGYTLGFLVASRHQPNGRQLQLRKEGR